MSDKTTKADRTGLIEDPLLGQYYLKVGDHQFAVHKRIESGHERQALSYHTNLAHALKQIVFLQTLNKLRGNSQTIAEFVKEYKSVGDRILAAFDINVK